MSLEKLRREVEAGIDAAKGYLQTSAALDRALVVLSAQREALANYRKALDGGSDESQERRVGNGG